MNRRLFWVVTLAAVLVLALCGVAAAEDGNIDPSILSSHIGGMAGHFHDLTEVWWVKFQKWGKTLWWILLGFDVIVIAFQRYAGGSDFADIVAQWALTIMIAAIPFYFVGHYEDWAKALYSIVMDRMPPELSVTAGQGHANGVGHPIDFVALMITNFVDQLKGLSKLDLARQLASGVVFILSIITYLSFTILVYILCLLMELMITVTQCEFWILAPFGALFIGMASLKVFHGYAWQVLKYLISVCIKLLVMTMIMDIGFGVIIESFGSMITSNNQLGTSIMTLLNMAGMTLLIVIMMFTIPGQCANLIGGVTGGGINPISRITNMVVGGAERQVATAAVATKTGAALGAAAGTAGAAILAAPLAPIALAAAGVKAAGRAVLGGSGGGGGGGNSVSGTAGPGAGSKTAQALGKQSKV